MSWRRLASTAQDALTRGLGERDTAGDSSVQYQPAGGSPVSLLGIFRDAHEEATLDAEIPFSTVQPEIAFKIADLPNYPPARGDRIILGRGQGDPEGGGSQTFRIEDHHPDGEGMVNFILKKTENG